MTRVAGDASTDSAVKYSVPQAGGQVDIHDARLMFSGDYARVGNDLHISADGQKVVVPQYFSGDTLPTLVSPEGATLGGDVVDRLAGPRFPGQYAQAGGGAAQEPIGQVESLTGSATATRIDGTVVTLKIGDHVFRQDLVQTGSNSSLSITFADRTIFSMQDDARMVLDQFAYAPGGSGNSLLFNLVQGAFAFIAGQVAPSGNMRVETPVATAGIRGTTGVLNITANNGATIFTLTNDPDGRLGAYGVFNKTTGALIRFLTASGESVLVRNALGDSSDINKTLDQVSTEQFVLGQAFGAFTLLQGRQQRGEEPVNPLPPEQQQPATPPGRRGAVDGQTQQASTPLSDERKLVELLPEVTEQDKWDSGEKDSTSPFLPTTFAVAGAISAGQPEDSSRFNVDLLQGVTGGGPLQVTNVQGLVPGVTLQGTSLVVDPTDPSFQSLAVGQERVITVTYTIVGANGQSLAQSASITISGVNDTPVVFAASGVATEDQIASGQISGFDVDNGETATLTYAVVGSAPDGFTLKSNGAWTFDSSDYDGLAKGETVNLKVSVVATDAQNASSAPAELTIKLTGVNDTPVVADGDVAGSVTEVVHPYGKLTDSGTIGFTDADLTDTHTVSVAGAGNLGNLTAEITQVATGGIGGEIKWTYKVDADDVEYLGEGETRIESFTVKLDDGNGGTVERVVEVTITGTNDKPVVTGGEFTGSVTEAASGYGTLQDTGKFGFSDVDISDVHEVHVTSSVGNLGTLSADILQGTTNGVGGEIKWTYTVDASKVESLGAYDKRVETFTVTLDDGNGGTIDRTVTVTINGSDDEPNIGGDKSGAVSEDMVLSASGTLTVADPDQGQSAFTSSSGSTKYGSYTIDTDGQWTYSLRNGDVQSLAKDQIANDSFTVTTADGTPQTIAITITGANDTPQFGGKNDGAVSEDYVTQAQGTLTIVDADAGQSSFKATSVTSAYGGFIMEADGDWTYVLDNADPSVQALKGNETVTDTFTVESADGTTEQVTITITGRNDEAVIGAPDNRHVTEDQGVVDGNLSVTGTITISDADKDEAKFKTTVIPLQGALGMLLLTAAGTYTYAVENDDVQFLGANQTHIDTFKIESVDGTQKLVSFVITGVNDKAVIGTPSVSQVTEDVNVKPYNMLQAKGIISVGDADQYQSALQTQVTGANGNIGSLQLAADGQYTYQVSNSAVQYLSAGETRIDTFTIKSVDGTVKVVDFTINGADDLARFSYGVPVGGGNVTYKDLQNTDPAFQAFDVLVSGNDSVNTNQNGFGIDGGNDIGPGDVIRFSFVLNATESGGSDGVFGVTKYTQWISDVRSGDDDHHHRPEYAKFDVRLVGMDGGAVSDFTVSVYNGSGALIKEYTGGNDIVVKEDWKYTIKSDTPFQTVEVSYEAGQPFKLGSLTVDAVVDGAAYESQTLTQAGLTPLTGGGGDDTLIVSTNPLPSLDGGHGQDTLKLDNGLDLDFTALAPSAVTSIETIDLSLGDHELRLSLADVLDLSETVNLDLVDEALGAGVVLSNTSNVLVSGDDGDRVELVAPNTSEPSGTWMQAAGGPVSVGGEAYNVFNFVSGSQIIASVAVDTEVAVQTNAAA